MIHSKHSHRLWIDDEPLLEPQPTDPLKFARGIIVATLLSIFIWSLMAGIGLIAWRNL